MVPVSFVGDLISPPPTGSKHSSVLSDVYYPKASTALFQSTTSHNLDSSLLWQMMLYTLLRGVGLGIPVTISVFTASILVRTDVFYLLKYYFYEFI